MKAVYLVFLVGLMFGSLRFYEYYADQKAYDYLIEMTKKSVDNLSKSNQKILFRDSNMASWVVKTEKVNDFTLKNYIQGDPSSNSLSEIEGNFYTIKEETSKSLLRHYCKDEKVGAFIGVGMVNIFSLSFENGIPIGDIVVDKKSCTNYFGNEWAGSKYATLNHK